MTQRVTPSLMDVKHLQIIRTNVTAFMNHVAATYLPPTQVGRLLDIAPQDHEGARPFFPHTIRVETLDIDPNANCTYHGDICTYNAFLDDNSFDFIVCTEVLEHTLQPFAAADELWRLLKPEGYLFVSVPFNFRIHGPLPDCWRFTEHGLRALLHRFTICEMNGIETPERPLMPIHYTVVAQKPVATTPLE
ncbi:MAG: methyltransferase [Cyanobacteria bacterium M5B4]|nr:MAG: methyltransferase [Cyanobacteria bacterium M5B4]